MLLSFPIVRKVSETANSQDYMKLEQKVKHLYQPLWYMEVLIWIGLASLLAVAVSTDNAIISILTFGLCQLITGWEAHSTAHNRHPILRVWAPVFSV